MSKTVKYMSITYFQYFYVNNMIVTCKFTALHTIKISRLVVAAREMGGMDRWWGM